MTSARNLRPVLLTKPELREHEHAFSMHYAPRWRETSARQLATNNSMDVWLLCLCHALTSVFPSAIIPYTVYGRITPFIRCSVPLEIYFSRYGVATAVAVAVRGCQPMAVCICHNGTVQHCKPVSLIGLGYGRRDRFGWLQLPHLYFTSSHRDVADMYRRVMWQTNVRASSRCTIKARLLTKTHPVPSNSVIYYLCQFPNNIGSMGMHDDKI